MAIIVGLRELNLKLDKLRTGNTKAAMAEACMLVERDAKEKCPTGRTGDLRMSIMSEYDEKEGRIGTNLYYAPYVHQGTGIYAINGDGRQDVPWVYYSEADEQFYSTVGIQPNPFLADAFEQNQERIAEIFSEKIKEAAK